MYNELNIITFTCVNISVENIGLFEIAVLAHRGVPVGRHFLTCTPI